MANNSPHLIFKWNIKNKPQTKILFNNNDKICDILQKFADQNSVKKEDYDYYYYDSQIIDDDKKAISDLIGTNSDTPIIDVSKKVKIIKCPKCVCNDSILKIENYHLSFSGCKRNHNSEYCFDEFKDKQKIDFSRIFCHEINSENQKDEIKDFYKCYECGKENECTTYYCDKCSREHSKLHPYEKKMIEFDKRNCYCFCTGELKKFTGYCEKCEKDFCENCQKVHQNKNGEHDIKEYKSIDLPINEINKNIKNIESQIGTIKKFIEKIKTNLYGSLQLIKKYAEIAKNIMRKYNFNKDYKNYRIVKTVKNLKNSNEQVKKQLEGIINEWNTQKKIGTLINIYLDERKWYDKNEEKINTETNKTNPSSSRGSIASKKPKKPPH